jgi:uncharacterized membrane protein
MTRANIAEEKVVDLQKEKEDLEQKLEALTKNGDEREITKKRVAIYKRYITLIIISVFISVFAGFVSKLIRINLLGLIMDIINGLGYVSCVITGVILFIKQKTLDNTHKW